MKDPKTTNIWRLAHHLERGKKAPPKIDVPQPRSSTLLKSILIWADNSRQDDSFDQQFAQAGYQVSITRDKKEFKKRLAEIRPDFVLVEPFVFPSKHNGDEILTYIREVSPNTTVVLQSAAHPAKGIDVHGTGKNIIWPYVPGQPDTVCWRDQIGRRGNKSFIASPEVEFEAVERHFRNLSRLSAPALPGS